MDEGQPPPDYSDVQMECLTPPGTDLPLTDGTNPPLPIGTVLTQPVSQDVNLSQERAQYEFSAVFVGANPRNIMEYSKGQPQPVIEVI